jgi:hypothetical protein
LENGMNNQDKIQTAQEAMRKAHADAERCLLARDMPGWRRFTAEETAQRAVVIRLREQEFGR